MSVNSNQNIGGDIFFRAKVFFAAILAVLFLSSTGSLYAGVRSGELEKKIIKPAKEKAQKLVESMQVKITPTPIPTLVPTITPAVDTSVSSEVDIKINTDNTYPTLAFPTLDYGSSNYEELRKKQDEWWANVREENQRKSEESKAALEEFKKQSEEKMRKFEEEAQKGLEEFREKYGH